MSILSKCILLFTLNWLDALLTLFWVRAKVATEGNALMAGLLDMGDVPFMATKLAVGAFAAYVLYRYSSYTVARRGMTLVLGLYALLMCVHAATGISALGWQGPTDTVVAFISGLGL
jgi:hypothetical protein